MPEIRINAKPCPKCGHRNVTGEARICERCGTSLTLDRRVRIMVLGSMILVFLIAGGVFAYNAMEGSNKNLASAQPEPIQEAVPVPENTPEETPAQVKPQPPATLVANNTSEEEAKTEDGPAPLSAVATPRARAYQDMVAGAQLVGEIPIRYKSGPMENFESDEFDLLVDLLQRDEFQDRQITIIGLSEQVAASEFMATNRADFARKLLKDKYQIHNPIRVVGFGPRDSGNNLKDPKLEIWVE